ncbi:MAG: hypothetical protein COA70_08610 [Planctomycetota bacterium]|nr:MAG: hypothetical protein COA70_08610 [Planctomycetota bacterium]
MDPEFSIPILNLPLVGFSLVAVTALAFHQSKKEKFPSYWKYLVGSGMAGIALVMNLRVQSIGTAFLQGQYLTILFFAWLVFCAALLWNQKKQEAKWFAIIPVLAIGLGRASTLLTSSHIEEAQARGDTLILRLDLYAEAKGVYPVSLPELSAFDHKDLPTTGVGYWSTQRFEYFGSEESCSLKFYGLSQREYLRSSLGTWSELGQ